MSPAHGKEMSPAHGKEITVQFERIITSYSSLFAWWQQYAEKKERKRKSNITVTNANESAWKGKPRNIFLWIFLFLLSRALSVFPTVQPNYECKGSVEIVRRFRLNDYGIDENRKMSQEYPLTDDSITFISFCIRGAKSYLRA